MTDILNFQPVLALDGNGFPVPGAQARFFASGTTTPVVVFANAAATIAHPSPLLADSAGRFPPVFLNGAGAIKVVVQDADGGTLYTLDPALKVPAGGAGAAQVSSAPFGSIAATNVQAALEAIFSAIAGGAAEFGIGVTGNAPILANVDSTTPGTGFYRFTDTATGTLPAALDDKDGIIWLVRRTASDAWQFAALADGDRLFVRRMTAGTWQTWLEWMHGGRVPPDPADGASTTPYVWTPAQVKAAVAAFRPALVASAAFTASETIDIALPAGFTDVEILVEVTASSAADVGLDAQFTRDAFATVLSGASDYRWGVAALVYGAAAGAGSAVASDTKMRVSAQGSNTGFSTTPDGIVSLRIPGYSNATAIKRVIGGATYINAAGNLQRLYGADGILTASDRVAAVNGLRLKPSSGNITGRYSVYTR